MADAGCGLGAGPRPAPLADPAGEPLLLPALPGPASRNAWRAAFALAAGAACLGAAAGATALRRRDRGQPAAADFRGAETLEGAGDCVASNEAACVQLEGCRWFHRDGPCPECEAWVGADASAFAGCRDWDPFRYCHDQIFISVNKNSKLDPRNPAFASAVRRYEFSQGTGGLGSPGPRRLRCDVWCDGHGGSCFGQPKAKDSLRGVNYGGRFIPEEFLGLTGTKEYLFKGVARPEGARATSLCDIGAEDAGSRMARFLDENIKREHFARMAEMGFNIVRLPLGYWNLIDLQAGDAPDGPLASKARWMNLQRLMPASEYRKWIDQVFEFAGQAGLRVLLDLHSAPGGQSGNECTGCDQGYSDAVFHFIGPDGEVGRNVQLAVGAVEAMARICAQQGAACYGIELLNEPYGAHTDLQYSLDLFRDLKTCAERAKLGMPCTGVQQMFTQEQLEDVPGLLDAFNASRAAGAPAPAVRSTYRLALKGFYERAIRAARAHLAPDTPIVIMEWPRWLRWWTEHAAYPYAEFGHIAFAAHLYKFPEPPSTKQQEARDFFQRDLAILRHFFLHSKYELMVSEYALNSHGPGGPDDHFDYNAFTDWSVSQFNQFGIGSMVWNFDSYWVAWGPVKNNHVGRSVVDWKTINGYQW